jgi:DNA-binding MarR family transcriptional regulator
MHLTVKQIELLRVIGTGNEDGSACDLDQIIERINYETTKASIQFSIRALIKHGLIHKLGSEKRRGRRHVMIGITPAGAGYVGVGVKKGPAYVIDEADDIGSDEFYEPA